MSSGFSGGADRKVKVNAFAIPRPLNFLGDGVTISENPITNAFDITITGGGVGGSGEINTAVNVGTGEGNLFRDKTGVTINLKTIKSGYGIGITNNPDDIEINTSDATIMTKGIVRLATNNETSSGVAVQGNDSRLSDSRIPEDHADTHHEEGTDPLTLSSIFGSIGNSKITDLSYNKLIDVPATYTPSSHAGTHHSGGGDDLTLGSITGSIGNSKITDLTYGKLTGVPASFVPSVHAASHNTAGNDVVHIDTIGSGSNITTNNASTAKHGLMPKLSNVNTEYMDGTGSWSVPAGSNAAGAGVAGSYTTSGVGSTTINIPHGFGTTPAAAYAWPKSTDAFGSYTTSVDATNITLTYTVTPPSGTNNLSYFYYASAATVGVGTGEGGTGDVSTASNQNVNGVGVFYTKNLNDLQFKGIHALTNKLSVVDNPTDKQIDIDVNQENLSIAYSQLTSLPTTYPPSPHATSHNAAGSDTVHIDTIGSGTDTTTNNASTSKHGLLRKLSNVSTQYLNGQGNWTTPATGAPSTATYVTLFTDTGLSNERTINAGDGITMTDNGANNTLLFAANHRIVQRSGSLVISNTTTETDLINYTIPANTLASASVGVVNRAIHLRCMGTVLQNAIATGTITLRVRLNNVEMYSDTMSSATILSQSTVLRPFFIDLILFSDGSTTAQGLGGSVRLSDAGTSTIGYGNLGSDEIDVHGIIAGANPAQDSTTDLVFRVTVQLNSASTNFNVTRRYAYIDNIIC